MWLRIGRFRVSGTRATEARTHYPRRGRLVENCRGTPRCPRFFVGPKGTHRHPHIRRGTAVDDTSPPVKIAKSASQQCRHLSLADTDTGTESGTESDTARNTGTDTVSGTDTDTEHDTASGTGIDTTGAARLTRYYTIVTNSTHGRRRRPTPRCRRHRHDRRQRPGLFQRLRVRPRPPQKR